MPIAFRELERDLRRARREATVFARAEDFRRIVSRRHADAFASVPVGNMNDLGPAIIATEVWGVTEDGFFWGSDNDYARDHAAFREAVLGEPLLYADPVLADRIFENWSEAVFVGFS